MAASTDLERNLPGPVHHGSPIATSSTASHTATACREEEEEVEENTNIARIRTARLQTPRTHTLATLAKTVTARSNASVMDPGPPPDGGSKAWIQACMGHLVILNTWGLVTTFGVFQTYYTEQLGMEPSAVSWIGSVQMLGHYSLGMLCGRALDVGFYFWSVIPGMLLVAVGMFMTSLCSQYWQFFLAQGIMIGCGCGLQFTPTLSLVSTYFARNRSVALAIMASGTATGGLIYPTIVRQLLPVIGFGWTVRTMAFIQLAIGICYCSLLKPRLPPRRSGPLFEWSAFNEPAYTFFLLGLFLICFGVFFTFYYITSFAVNIIGVSYSTSINLLLVMNGIGLIGRLIPGYIADKWLGPYNTLIPLCLITSVILYCWAAVNSVASLYAFAVLYGFFCAGYQGIFPAVLSSLTKDMTKAGTRNGMGFGIVGVASLTGPPIAGALIQNDGGGYLTAQMWGASMMLAGTLMVIVGRISITGWKLMVRV